MLEVTPPSRRREVNLRVNRGTLCLVQVNELAFTQDGKLFLQATDSGVEVNILSIECSSRCVCRCDLTSIPVTT